MAGCLIAAFAELTGLKMFTILGVQLPPPEFKMALFCGGQVASVSDVNDRLAPGPRCVKKYTCSSTAFPFDAEAEGDRFHPNAV